MNTTTATYKELKDFIKKSKSINPSSKNFWGNYTHETTEGLRDLVDGYLDEYGNVEEQTPVQQTNIPFDVNSVVGLLEKALGILKTSGNYTNNEELQALHAKAMEIEFELENSNN